MTYFCLENDVCWDSLFQAFYHVYETTSFGCKHYEPWPGQSDFVIADERADDKSREWQEND